MRLRAIVPAAVQQWIAAVDVNDRAPAWLGIWTRRRGAELEVGNTGNWGAQAMDLSPAQGGFVEFTLAEDGLYPLVTHAFNYVGRGALGLFQAGDGDPKN